VLFFFTTTICGAMSPTARSLRARLAALELHASTDSREHTRPARAAFMERFERQVDPDGVLPLEERQRRAECAKRAYFTRLALRSAQARQSRKSERSGRA
jgi:hypothetical protein